MRKILILSALLALTTTADAGYESRYSRHGGSGFRAVIGVTQFPSHWLLDRGPRVVDVPYRMDGSGPVVPFSDNPDWGKNTNNGRGCRSCFDASQ